jgi:hypothetical protein
MGVFRPGIVLLVFFLVTAEHSPAPAQGAPAPSQVMPPVIEPYRAPTRIVVPHRYDGAEHRHAVKHKKKRRSGTRP